MKGIIKIFSRLLSVTLFWIIPKMSPVDGRLCLAAMNGNIDDLVASIHDGADVEANAGDNLTPIIIASQNGHRGVVSFLLEAGANVNAKADITGMTALARGAGRGHYDVVRLLLENGATVDARNCIQSTALIEAAKTSSVEIVKLLLEYGADVNARTNTGCTALMWAAHYGRLAIADMLILNGAEINAVSDTGVTALKWAVKYHHKNLLQLLQNPVSINDK